MRTRAVMIPDGLRGRKLGSILTAMGAIAPGDERAILQYSAAAACTFGVAAIQMGLVNESAVVRALSLQAGAPSVSLAGFVPDASLRRLVPASLAWRFRILPLSLIARGASARAGSKLVVASSRPLDPAAVDEIGFATGATVVAVIAKDADLDASITVAYGPRPESDRRRRVDLSDGPGLEHVVSHYFIHT